MGPSLASTLKEENAVCMCVYMQAIIEDEDEAADFRKARPSRRGSAAKNPSALSSKKKRNILDDSG